MSSTSSRTTLTAPEYLQTTDFSFVDVHGRTVHLRGVNLSGANKAPLHRPSHILKDFWETAEAGGESFIGQPLNLEDGTADEHLARLRGWGFDLLRFPVTWEALEHAGPGKYDYEFMDYVVRVLLKCKQYGFRVYMDPHQDIWSRFSGGSGAPFWTLPACGINPRHLSATQSALIHAEYPLPHVADPATFPAMIWSTNYGRLLSQTIFTLFFAGRTFAPNCMIDGVNIQDYLQSHFIAAFGELADRIKRADEEEGAGLRDACVIGWDCLNEPSEGLVEWDDLHANPRNQGTTLKKGTYPTPLQSLCLGMGKTQTVESWDFGMFGPKRTGTVTIDPKGRKVWADPAGAGENGGEAEDGTHPFWGWKRDVSKWPLGTCIWAQHGVWDVETEYVLRPDYFKYDPATGIEVEFIVDFWLPFFQAYGERIRGAHPNAILFVQPPVFALPPEVSEEVLKGRCVYTGHYYDGLTLVTKHWNWFNADALGVLRGKYRSRLQAVKIGESAIRKSLMEQISTLRDDAKIISTATGGYPTVIGEIGIPYDMDEKYAYYTSLGDYSSQEKALDASLNACDGYNNVNYTIWTYLPHGHTHKWGDGWNGEDLSLWSPDDLRSNYLKREADYTTEEDDGHESDLGDGGLRRRRPIAVQHNGKELIGTEMTTIQGPESMNITTIEPQKAPSLNVALSDLERDTDSPCPSPSVGGSTPVLPLLKKPSIAFSSRTMLLDEHPLSKMKHSSSPDLMMTRDVDPDEDPYDFLTDGARAVRAFCRPRPMNVVGKVVDVKFDMAQARFSCSINVTSSSPLMRTGNTDAELATEIYLPLVHYAGNKWLQNSRARWNSAGSKIILGKTEEYSSYTTGGSEKRLMEGIEEREDLLDVEVKVSGGKWRIKGQVLYWQYPLPVTGSMEYTIEVKRRGGPIKVKQGGWIEVRSSQDGLDNDDGGIQRNICEKFCCEYCVVM